MTTGPSRNPEPTPEAFWREQAEKFTDLYPAIAALCRERANHFWLAREADRLRARVLELESAATSSESAKPDSGTVKILTDLLDRAYKMHVMAGTATYLAAQDADQNDPLLAWLSDVRSVLYGKTKLEPRVPTSGERPESK